MLRCSSCGLVREYEQMANTSPTQELCMHCNASIDYKFCLSCGVECDTALLRISETSNIVNKQMRSPVCARCCQYCALKLAHERGVFLVESDKEGFLKVVNSRYETYSNVLSVAEQRFKGFGLLYSFCEIKEKRRYTKYFPVDEEELYRRWLRLTSKLNHPNTNYSAYNDMRKVKTAW